MVNAVSVNSLRGGYRGREVFRDLSLEVPAGRFTALLGPNGSGKSTLLHFLLRTLKPSGGTISICSRDIGTLSQRELAGLIAYVPQSYLIPDGFTVRGVISMTDFAGRRCSDADIDRALEKVGIPDLADRRASGLSGGEAQLVMLCRAICCDAPVILMDEPTNNLDINRQSQLLGIASGLVGEGRTVLCALHDLNLALGYADYCHVLSGGKLICSGKPADVVTQDLLKTVFSSDARIISAPGSEHPVVVL